MRPWPPKFLDGSVAFGYDALHGVDEHRFSMQETTP
jgi:hypothetical protein